MGLWEHSDSNAVGSGSYKSLLKPNFLESLAVVGNSPVGVRQRLPSVFPSSTGLLKSRVNLAGPPAKPKYFLVTDSGLVP